MQKDRLKTQLEESKKEQRKAKREFQRLKEETILDAKQQEAKAKMESKTQMKESVDEIVKATTRTQETYQKVCFFNRFSLVSMYRSHVIFYCSWNWFDSF